MESAIKNKENFILASPRAGNLTHADGQLKGQRTVFGRELQLLEAAGYKKVGPYMIHPSYLRLLPEIFR
jgi:hypothetical protein